MNAALSQQKQLSRKAQMFWQVCAAFVCLLAWAIQPVSDGYLVFTLNTPIMYAFGVLAFLLARAFFAKGLRLRLSVLFVALFFAITFLFGNLYEVAGTLRMSRLELACSEGFETVRGVPLALVVMAIGYALFFYMALDWVYGKLARFHAHERAQKPLVLFGRELTMRLCVIILLVAWLAYIVVYFPGTVTSDTSRHLTQVFGSADLPLDTHFPYLTGLIYGGLYQLGLAIDPSGWAGIFLMMSIQIVLGLAIFSLMVVWLGRLGAPRWLALGALAFFALFPLVPTYMVSIGKDTLHALFVALLALQTLVVFTASRASDSKGMKTPWFASPVAIGICALLIALTRNGGIAIALVGVFAIAFLRPKRSLAIVGASVLVLFGLWQFALLPACGVQSEGPRESLSLPSQIAAASLNEGVEMSEEDLSVFEQSYQAPLRDIGNMYDPDLSDNVKYYLEPESLSAYLSAVASVAFSHPSLAIDAALHTTYRDWYPFCVGGIFNSEYSPYVCAPGDLWAHPEWFASYEELPAFDERIQAPNKILRGIRALPVVSLLYAPGSYVWLLAFVIGFAFYARRSRRCCVALALPFATIVAIMVAGPVAAIRYALPFIFALPLLLMILFGRRDMDQHGLGDSPEA